MQDDNKEYVGLITNVMMSNLETHEKCLIVQALECSTTTKRATAVRVYYLLGNSLQTSYQLAGDGNGVSPDTMKRCYKKIYPTYRGPDKKPAPEPVSIRPLIKQA